MKRTDNPFDGLGIRYPQAKYGDGSIKQKAFFEQGSYESELIPLEDRVKILAKFVLEGYDMHKLVDNYLDEKDALNNDIRKFCIASTFRMYADEIFLEPECEDWKNAVTKMLTGNENKTSLETMCDAIDKFIEAINVYFLGKQ